MKKYLRLLIPFLAVILSFFLSFTSLEKKVADLFQRVLSPLEEKDTVLMINIDDAAVENIGTWPFPRDVYSKALITLKELGAEAAVFDLSFLDKSQARVNKDYVSQVLPRYVDSAFENLDSNVYYFLESFADGSLKSKDAEEVSEYYSQISSESKNSIQTSISYSIQDIDSILANGLKFFENSYLTLTFGDDFTISDDEKEYLSNYVALNNIEVAANANVMSYDGVQPAISEFLTKAKSAGFVNADSDKDGYLRRLHLIFEYDGKYYGQLVFIPILEHFGNPKIEVSKRYITLKNCRMDNLEIKDIKIPLDQDGSVVVKYPKNKSYYDYNALSFWSVYRISLLEEVFSNTLKELEENGFFSFWKEESPYELYQNIAYIREALYEGESEDFTYDLYSYYVSEFYNKTRLFLNGGSEEILLASVEGDEETAAYISETFANCRALYEKLIESRERVKQKVSKAICIFGTSATSTTDFGLTQYQDRFPNPGVHYTLANQLLTQDFVTDSSVWISVLITVILCFGYILLAKKIKSTGRQMIFGASLLVVTFAVLLIFFVTTKIYVGTAIPIIALAACFIAQTVMNLITTSREKKFIRGAFAQCLSPDVVAEIEANPESFKLGGQTINMTAIFTDIQKFSGFSELLTAGQLVALLNYYLTKMSDIIMENRGTVDKYEGDAIVAFVGAPIKTDKHAALACKAAIDMKKAEIEINKEIEKIASAPKPDAMDDDTYDAFCLMVKNHKTIFTRIGLNSGDIVAGYMGSTNKKNYTMMGNNVNLASRLEGVNKQYRTGGILMSAATRSLLGNDFIVRSLDRVQVVNVITPIRLYELLETREDADESLLEYVNNWEDTMKIFESGDYAKALEGFKKLSAIRPGDNVAKYYIELIEKFFINGKYPTESDDFGVAYNPENPEEMNEMWLGTSYEIKGTFKLLQK